MTFAGSCTLVGLFFLPETFAAVLLARKARRLRRVDPEKNKELYAESERVSWDPMAILERTIFRPFKDALSRTGPSTRDNLTLSRVWRHLRKYFFFFIVQQVYPFLTIGCAVFQGLPVIFIHTRHFSISNDGPDFIGIGIGSILAAFVNVWFLRPYPILAINILWLGRSGHYESVPWCVNA
jgi:hypothetical protein